MEIRRFGFGHRRPDGPAGSHGVRAALIHSDARGTVTELAFARQAVVEPHTNPNTSWFVVIEGGGFVRVGDETERVFAGEAVLWPAGAPHGAMTELSEMRAIVVEFPGADDAAARGVVEGAALVLGSGSGGAPATPAAPGDGELAADGRPPAGYDPREGEPV